MYGTAYDNGRIYQAGRDQQITHGTNATAVMAAVAVFVFAPLAILLGHIARSQIRRTHEGGGGLALAALIAGYLITIVSCWALAVLMPQFMNDINRMSDIPIPTP